MTLTPRQIANRANAQKSTGPKTAEGKARSSLNAMKHGMTAEHLVLPNEDSNAFETRKTAWFDDLQPADITERALVERAAIAEWRLQRCVLAEQARLASRVRHAAEEHDLQQFRRAEELGGRLIHDPLNRCIVPPLDPRTQDKLEIWRQNNPPAILRELQGFRDGVEWMIDRWLRLGGILEREGFWHYPEKFEAIKLLGSRPDDALNDERAGAIFMACRALHPEPWDITADIQQAALGCEGRPIYAVRAQRLEERTSMTSEQAFTLLGSMVQVEVARLRELKESRAERAAIDRSEAEARAMFDDSKEAALLLRYESARARDLRNSLLDLQKKRKDEENAAKRAEKETNNETEAPAESAPDKRRSTRRTAPPNEPKPPANDTPKETAPRRESPAQRRKA